jgi:threonine dehydrogenase-like Zn-dependent dehydrogenase
MVETYLAEAGTAVFEKALRQMARITHPGGKVIMTTGIQYLPPETLPREEFDDLEAFFGREGAIYVSQDTGVYRFDKYLDRLANQRSVLEVLINEGLLQPDRIIRHYYQPGDAHASTTSLILEVL